ARIGTTRATPDYFALQVLNTILGGAFTSRLNMNLRETHGYTYGAFSGFDYRPMPGPFVARAAVQTNVTDKSLTEFMKELNGIMQPIPADELDKAKNYLALRYPENFQTVAQITNQLSDMVTYNLPDNYFNNYVQRVLAVSEKDVENAAKKYLDPSAMDIIVVGDRKVVEKGIDSLGIAPIKNFSIDDVLGKAPTVEGNK
ncbi:MAG TPA: insulinase family protein, partial [Bacteroidota bacterium]|nr:insulinase family protein [Bacteroidota bacterium]